jgi:hypothetical protein
MLTSPTRFVAEKCCNLQKWKLILQFKDLNFRQQEFRNIASLFIAVILYFWNVKLVLFKNNKEPGPRTELPSKASQVPNRNLQFKYVCSSFIIWKLLQKFYSYLLIDKINKNLLKEHLFTLRSNIFFHDFLCFCIFKRNSRMFHCLHVSNILLTK